MCGDDYERWTIEAMMNDNMVVDVLLQLQQSKKQLPQTSRYKVPTPSEATSSRPKRKKVPTASEATSSRPKRKENFDELNDEEMELAQELGQQLEQMTIEEEFEAFVANYDRQNSLKVKNSTTSCNCSSKISGGLNTEGMKKVEIVHGDLGKKGARGGKLKRLKIFREHYSVVKRRINLLEVNMAPKTANERGSSSGLIPTPDSEYAHPNPRAAVSPTTGCARNVPGALPPPPMDAPKEKEVTTRRIILDLNLTPEENLRFGVQGEEF